MSGERCPTCDRPRSTAPGPGDCPRADIISVVDGRTVYDIDPHAVTACNRTAVDWRSRCLAAERDRDEAVARAERAEAECGAMRVVCATAEIYLPGEGCITEPACGACRYCDLYRTVDEWRRTRQSKEGT